jgi:sugar lactone lactonase YvrE
MPYAHALLLLTLLASPSLAQDKAPDTIPTTIPAPQPTPQPEPRPSATTVFAALKPTLVCEGIKFAEGPLWWKDAILVCDLAGSVVYRVTPSADDTPAVPEVFRENTSSAAGATLDPQGRLMLAHFGGFLSRTEADGTITKLPSQWTNAEGASVPLAKCNDLAIRRDGTIYFTDFGGKTGPDKSLTTKGLFIARGATEGADATAITLTNADADFAAANGVALSPDERTLYVADYGKNQIFKYAVADDGSLSGRTLFADLSAEKTRGRTDGLKVRKDGTVFTTGPGGIWVIASDGSIKTRLDLESGASNVAFGEGHEILFITAGSKVWSIRLSCFHSHSHSFFSFQETMKIPLLYFPAFL